MAHRIGVPARPRHTEEEFSGIVMAHNAKVMALRPFAIVQRRYITRLKQALQ